MVTQSAKFKKDLEDLNVLHRQGIRLCLGAFKSSPIESLYVEERAWIKKETIPGEFRAVPAFLVMQGTKKLIKYWLLQ